MKRGQVRDDVGVQGDIVAGAARGDRRDVDGDAEHQRDVGAHRAVPARARQLDCRLLRSAGYISYVITLA